MVQKAMHWIRSISKQEYEEFNHGASHCSEPLFVLTHTGRIVLDGQLIHIQ